MTVDFTRLARDLAAFAKARANRIEVWIQIVDVDPSGKFGGIPAERFRFGTWPPPTPHQPKENNHE